MSNRLHENELPVDPVLVRRIVDDQFPHLADLPLIRLAASGSSNVQFRLGDELLVRLPRQPGGGAAVAHEARWSAVVGSQLSVAVPEIVGIGEPAHGYPERWSVVRWLDGDLPRVCRSEDPPDAGRSRLASDLAAVILDLHRIALPDTAATDHRLRNYRGGMLADFDGQMRRNIATCRAIEDLDLDLDAAMSIWQQALRLPGASKTESVHWYHGDLVAENLLLNEGRLSAVLDFGGLGVGDPTIDLHGAWELFDPPARAVFRRQLAVDEAGWLRGRAWALAVALMTFSYYWTTMPGRVRDRMAMARAVLADAAG